MQLQSQLVHAEPGQRVVLVSAWQQGACLGSALGRAATPSRRRIGRSSACGPPAGRHQLHHQLRHHRHHRHHHRRRTGPCRPRPRTGAPACSRPAPAALLCRAAQPGATRLQPAQP
ncbi:hypothetical protein [Cyanobium sp. ULC084]